MAFWLDALLSVLLAPRCVACSVSLDHPSRGAVCAGCWESIRPLTPPLCLTCGDPLATWRLVDLPAGRCPRCRRLPRQVDRARAVGVYDGALRSIVQALKYDGRRSLARSVGRLMRERGQDILEGADWVVPVPLHPSRRRHRGFNQADDLARHLGLPVLAALRRVRATRPQADLPAARRHANVRRAFAVHCRAEVLCGTVVVLVDDVSTTGATLDACARALKEEGAAEVRALTAARVVNGPR